MQPRSSRRLQVIQKTLAALAVFCAGAALAAVIHVPDDCATIQEALDSASPDDTVLVAPGTYIEHITWPSIPGIDLIGEFGADSTVIDGDNINRVLTIASGVDTTTLISGFTIAHGYSTDSLGGGIYCYNSSPTIRDNIIARNHSIYDGGGIFIHYHSSPTIKNNIISENSAFYGGGICIYYWSSPLVEGNTIFSNSATGGGGLQIIISSPIISSNTILANAASDHGGGGIRCWTSAPTINDNLIASNATTSSGGGILCNALASPLITANKIIDNSAEAQGGAVFSSGNSSPVINNNDIYANRGKGVFNSDPAVTLNAMNNWWGKDTGPHDPAIGSPDHNPSGEGDAVSDHVSYRPWLTEPISEK
jgi:parallel beta-helix repeat protein